jgi:methionine salvage enolase-phosphatase E1
MLFLSDIREELDAAHTAGLHTCWLVRDGALPANPPAPGGARFRCGRPAALTHCQC